MFEVIIGTSGWWYDHWQGKFYPPDMGKSAWFSYYSRFFSSVEINSTFYRLPFPNMVKGWAKKAPEGFKFTLKVWRRITHLHKLRNVKPDMEVFMERISPLKNKMGAFLYQLPPSLRCDPQLLEDFLLQIPQEFDQAVEFRNKSWLNKEIFSILKNHGVAFCIVSMPDFPEIIEVTCQISYIRFHGKKILYGSSYSNEELLSWAKIIKDFSKEGVKRVYVYFNNDYEAFAVFNALRLQEILQEMV